MEIGFSELTKQIHYEPVRTLRCFLGARCDSSIRSTSMALGEHTARAFCLGAFANTSPPSAFQCLLYLHRAFRHTSHRWRALYLCKDASGPVGKAFFRIFAKPFRSGRSFWIRIFSGIPGSRIVAPLQWNPARVELLAAACDHPGDQRFF